MRLKRIGILAAATTGLALSQTTPPAPLAFEVASIKLHEFPQGQMSFRFSSGPPTLHATGNRFTEPRATLQDLLIDAYGVKDYQLAGMPDWGKVPGGEHYDVIATSPGDATPTHDQLRLMLQTLLADRFQLKLHHETKELPVYALVIGKGGSKMKEITPEERKPPPSNMARSVDTLEMPALSQSTIPMLIQLLGIAVDRPVIDHTGLTGSFEYPTLNWRQFGQERRAGPVDPDAGQSVFGAIQSQLGLKLEPRKEPTDILVIDHAEKPSEN